PDLLRHRRGRAACGACGESNQTPAGITSAFEQHHQGHHPRERVMRRAVALLALVSAIGSPAIADPVDDFVRAQMKARGLPGLSIAIVKDNAIVKAEGYGLASLELQAPATRDTVYELGSISKQFAADALLLLVEEHKVGLDDPL